ncbi:MAG: undecaprenyl-phosphate glucose phosphotransferase [bacterium]
MTIKQKEKIILFICLLLVDIFVINFSFLFSYWLRFESNLIPTPLGKPSLNTYFPIMFFITIIWLLVFKTLNMYEKNVVQTKSNVFYSIFKPVLFCIVIIITISFFFREYSFSRILTLIYFFNNVFFIFLGRIFIWKIFLIRKKKGYGLTNLAIIGYSNIAENIAYKIETNPELGYNFVGFIFSSFIQNQNTKKILGKTENIREIFEKNLINDVFILTKHFSHEDVFSFITISDEFKINICLIPDMVEMMTSNVIFEKIKGIPIIKIKEIPIQGVNLILKRITDIIFSSLLLILFLPLMIIIALLIKTTSPGKFIYKQKRIGRDEKQFTLYKFRTMVKESNNVSPKWSNPNDPRITLIGNFLRTSCIDELPQLFNVLKGDMSLIGPRPEQPFFVEQFKEFIPRYFERHKIKSGITGWAQVNGLKGDTLIEQRIKYDLYYIENWSLWFDFQILLKTLGIFISSIISFKKNI